MVKVSFLALLSLATFASAADPTPPPPQSAKDAVGISSQDGLTMSGTDVLITRNGVSERLTKEMTFASGAKIMADGTLVGTDGSKTMMRPGQIVTLDGKLMASPVKEVVPAAAAPAAPAAQPTGGK